ncbi:hypothetical protein PISMIDRAFT_327640 [Pisolithus microcarpus 441]|uniref:Uncharacterized protein n=1 Tax=Pisolithus microcarpus 441 TaxID=765257 RepID=A0A0C9YLN9_9AGAM|nr:hypothetical protein PISMIDRAFT_327640 [Pisolithus microcarpus 441]
MLNHPSASYFSNVSQQAQRHGGFHPPVSNYFHLRISIPMWSTRRYIPLSVQQLSGNDKWTDANCHSLGMTVSGSQTGC